MMYQSVFSADKGININRKILKENSYVVRTIHKRQNIVNVKYVNILAYRVTTYPLTCKVVLIEYHAYNAQFKHGDIS